MYTRWRKVWDSLTSSYWFLPVVMMTLAMLLWAITGRLDHLLSARDKKEITWLYLSDADTMRTVLLTIAAAIVGIVGVVFSIIMVPLSIAASQFGPRLLRTFLRDTGTQITLGTFNATFIFCMAVLLRLSSATRQPLPQLSVNIALLLGICSFGVLIYFINHISFSLQAPVVVARVAGELHTAVRHDFPMEFSTSEDRSSPSQALLPPVSEGQSLVANRSGYLQLRDDEALLRLASRTNVLLELLCEPGDFIVRGQRIAWVWGNIDQSKLTDAVNQSYFCGIQRTLVQDVTFGINELAEVAIRALSAAINDPFTVITCLDWIASALCELCHRKFPPANLWDQDGQLRVVRHPITFGQLTDAAFTQIRENSRSNRVITLKLIDTLAKVAACCVSADQQVALLTQVSLIKSGCTQAMRNTQDLNEVLGSANQLVIVLNQGFGANS